VSRSLRDLFGYRATWIIDLGTRLSPAAVAECHRLMQGVMRSAVRDHLLAFNLCEGIRLPRRRRKDTDDQTATAAEVDALLNALPHRYRPLVGLAVGTGLRWGECVGLRWDAIDLDNGLIRVIRAAVEVASHVSTKPLPQVESRPPRRTIPPFVASMLDGYAHAYPPGPLGEVFINTTGDPMRRSLFQSRIWRPALVRGVLTGPGLEAEKCGHCNVHSHQEMSIP
jgi:integrase